MSLRVLVTGAAGFIGSHTCDQLLAAGHSVLGADDLSAGRLGNLTDARTRPAFGFERVDLLVPGALERLVADYRPDAIVHLAALVSVRQSIENPDRNFALNVGLTHAVAEAARRSGVARLVFASSAAVYGDNPALPLAESAPFGPLSPYGAAKAASEQLLLGHARAYGFVARCQRYFNVYGPRQDPASPYSGVIAIFSRLMRRGESPVVYGDGGQSRDFVSVHDVARANVIAATRPGLASGVVNICSGQQTSLLDLVAALARATGHTGAVRCEAAKPGDIRHSLGDPSAARAELGFKAEISLGNGLAELVAGSSG